MFYTVCSLFLFACELDQLIMFDTFISFPFNNRLLLLFPFGLYFCKPYFMQWFYFISTIVDPLPLFSIIWWKLYHKKYSKYLQYYCMTNNYETYPTIWTVSHHYKIKDSHILDILINIIIVMFIGLFYFIIIYFILYVFLYSHYQRLEFSNI